MANITEHVIGCLDAFRSVSVIKPEEARDCPEKARWKIRDEFSRFKVWSGNIGAHQQGRSSLDYRLRDASHLATQVKNLLSDLKSLLDTAYSILDGTQIPWEKGISDEEDDDISGPEEDDIGFSTELDQISADVIEVNNCLLNLSVSIRNPAPHDRFRGSANTDTSYYEPADIAHVKAKCEHADPRLIEQLGKANSRRRQYFKYRQSHHQKLSHGIDLDLNSAERQSTVASSIPSAMKANVSKFIDTVDADELSDSGFTQTSYAPSTETSDRPRFPALPAKAADGPFECPFCFMMITVSTSYAWRKHVYADLRPYSCVAISCPLAGTEFGRRRQWMEHMLQSHWRDWYCSFCAHEEFTSAVSFQDHLKSVHAEVVSRNELEAVTNLCERARPFSRDTKCPICHYHLASVKKYRHHVGRHLVDIALFILPKVYEDEEMSGEDASEYGIERDSSHTGSGYIYRGEVSKIETGEEHQSELEWSDAMEHLDEQELSEDNPEQEPSYANRAINEIREENKQSRDELDRLRDELEALIGRRRGESSIITRDLDLQQLKDKAERADRARVERLEGVNHKLLDTIRDWKIQNETVQTEENLELIRRHFEQAFDEYKKGEAESVPKNDELEQTVEYHPELWNTLNRKEGRKVRDAEGGIEEEEEEEEAAAARIKRDNELIAHRPAVPAAPTPLTPRRGSVSSDYVNNTVEEEAKEDREEREAREAQIQQQNERIANRPKVPAAPDPFNSRRSSIPAEYDDSIVETQAENAVEKHKEEREREYEHRLREHLRGANLVELEINDILAGKEIEKKTTYAPDARPTYTRMARRHLSLETLNVHNVDYQLDSNPDFVLIQRWVPDSEQDALWGHTRLIREERAQKLLAEDKQKGKNLNEDATIEPELTWVRKKEHRRSRSPGLLMYLAGGKPP